MSKTLYKIIVFILIQGFLIVDVTLGADLSLLSPDIQISEKHFQQMFDAKEKESDKSVLSSVVREVGFLNKDGFKTDLIMRCEGKTLVFMCKEELHAHGGGRVIFHAYDLLNGEEKLIGHLDLTFDTKVLSLDSANIYNAASLRDRGDYPSFAQKNYRGKYYTGKLLLLLAVRYAKALSDIKYLKYENPTDQVKRLLIEIFGEGSERALKIDKQEWRGLLEKERTQDVIADISKQAEIVFVNKSLVDEKNKMEEKLLPGVIDLNYAQLQKTLERFLNPNENFSASDLELPELLNLMEVQLFYDTQWQMIENDAGEYFFNLPPEKISGYFKDYLNELTDIENLARRGINQKDIGSFELFVKLQQVVNAKEKVSQRWKFFTSNLGGPEIGEYSQLFADKSFDADNPELKAIMLKCPEFRMFIERSLAVYYKDFLEFENILKDELKRRITGNPGIVKIICNKIHNSDIDISDRSIDWLFGIESLKTEKELQKKALGKEYEGEKYFYDDYYTPYAVLRNIIKAVELQPEDMLYDLGSGYGRVLFYALFVTKVGRCKGIELIPGRVQAVLKAKDVLGVKDVDFVEGNVCEECFEDGTVFFMYNPFGRETTKAVVDKLRDIAKRKKIKVISWGREITDFLNEQKDWLRAKQSIKSNNLGEVDIIVFESISDNVCRDAAVADKITEQDSLLEQAI